MKLFVNNLTVYRKLFKMKRHWNRCGKFGKYTEKGEQET
jgi:hypothetical protein